MKGLVYVVPWYIICVEIDHLSGVWSIGIIDKSGQRSYPLNGAVQRKLSNRWCCWTHVL